LELQISRRTKTVKEAPTDAEVESLRARRDDLKNEFDSIFGKPELTEAQRIERATKAVQRSLDEYERQLREGAPAKSKKPSATSPELEAMRARRDGLKEMLSLLRDGPNKSPEEISLQAFKTRTANRIADLKERIAQGDFTKETRKPIQFDEEALKLKAENERLKNEFKAGVERDRLSNRSKAQIAFDTFLKWRRGFVLSGIRTLGKLTDAAILRMISGPVEDIVGSAIGKVVPSLASKARLEGTFRPSAEVKGITEALTKGMKDAWETLTKGESSLDVVYGKTRVMDRSFVDFFGRLHGALKAPVKRAEFERAFQKLSLFDQEHGIDITDPLVQTRNAIEAYRYANRQIFLQDNALVSAYKAALKTLETKKGETGKPSPGSQAIAGTAKLLLPIVRVPTNLVAETAEYAVGSVTGSVKLGLIAKRGIETMTEAEANLVLRQLKKGSLGLAFMLIGFFNPELIPMGGYFQRGQKREKDSVPYGAARLYGVDVPRSMIEHPAIEASQIGATVRNVSDSKMRKNGDEQGITAGLMAGALGLVEEAPFMREMIGVSKSFDPHTRTEFLGEMAKGILIPQLLQQLASFMDKDPEGNPVVRHPTTFVEHLKTGIPGLRSSVPEKGETGKLKTLKSK
jgi:hypothetical protein